MNLPVKYQSLSSFSFGDNPALCDALLALVISGKKTATCGALRDYDGSRNAEEMPAVGGKDLVLNSASVEKCVIETTEVTILKFNEVSEAFALAEGEGDFTDWRKGHIDFFERNGGWDENMDLVCERFKLVEAF